MRALAAVALALVAALALAPAASAHRERLAGDVAEALERDPLFVHPIAGDRLTTAQRGRIRLRIARRAIGRVKIAVLPGTVAVDATELADVANEIDAKLDVRGALVVVTDRFVHVITSYRDAERGRSAVARAFNRRPDDRLARELVASVDNLARADPGPEDDVQQQGVPGRSGGRDRGEGSTPGSTPGGGPLDTDIDDTANDFLDDIGEAFRLAALIVALAIALPFVIGGFFLVRRHRRREGQEAQALADARSDAHDALVALGDELRELDFDVSLPGVNEAAVAYYNNALGAYERGDRELQRADGPRRLARAQAEIAEGRRQIAGARALLAGPPAPAAGERRDA
jgi:hypothetical protein